MGKIWLLCLILLLAAASPGSAVSVENLKKLNIPETNLLDPVLSPDGTKIAYVAYDNTNNKQIFIVNADGTGEKKITSDDVKKWGLAWGQDKLAYTSFGADGLEKIFVINPDGTGNKQLIPDDKRQGNSEEDKPPAWAAPSWSPDGKFLVYTSLDENSNQKIYMVRSDGTDKRLLVPENSSRQWSPAFSLDGKYLAYISYNDRDKTELFVLDLSDNTKKQITSDEIKKNYPVWGPDGTIAYVSYETVTSSGEKIFAINQNGTDRRLFVNSTDLKQRSPSFSRDGREFAYAAIDLSGTVRVAIGNVTGIITTPTPTATLTATATYPSPTETAQTKPTEGKPARSVLWTVLTALGIIVVILLIILAITEFRKR